MDPSIRKSLQKQGVSLIQNLETGFDTEYVNKDMLTNKIISVQIAQHLQCYLKLPLPSRYKLCKINPVTEAKYPVKITKSFNFGLIETIIANHVEWIRLILYGNNDVCMSTLIDTMLTDPKLKCFENQDNVIIRLPKSTEKVLIKLIGSEGYSLQKLLTDSTSLSKYDIFNYRREVITKLKDALIHYNHLLENSVNLKKNHKLNLGIDVIETEGNLLYNFGEIFNEIAEMKDVKFNNESNKETINEISADIDNESINEIGDDNDNDKLIEKLFCLKAISRKNLTITRNNRISINYVFNNVIIGHNTPADLSILSDFEKFKYELDIVNKGFITLGKGFRYNGYNVVVRDTMLLAPAGQKSLANIGKLYNFEKINLSDYEITHMDILLKENPSKFYEYALRDPLITLKHASWMEEFHFSVKGQGIPTTLSSLGNKFVKDYWYSNGYPGYQIEAAPDFLIGEASSLQTPLGLSKFGELGLKLSLYISNYKGGRNESFMYGVDLSKKWYDYDLTSAYTTVLSNAGHPDYSRGYSMSSEDLECMSPYEVINSYTIIKCSFKFPNNTKYPSIPVYVDETTTVYPLIGKGAILTGAEYYLAKTQGCYFDFEEIYTVPYYRTNDLISKTVYPFKDIINEIQLKRREHAKGTISNLMYKEIGNSIYGSLVRGMGDKRKYDNKLKRTVRMKAHYLTNPLIASWVTGYIRSIIGECLHNIHTLGGLVVSVTTDGYIIDIKDLETLIFNDPKCKNTNYLLKSFTDLRYELSGDKTGLELKQISEGIITWTTRGQLGIKSKLKATTGFQSYNYTQDELNKIFSDLLKVNNKNKSLEYLQTSLRSPIDIVKIGGHVTKKYRDQKFSLLYDNRREIIEAVPETKTKNIMNDNNINLISFEKNYTKSNKENELISNYDNDVDDVSIPNNDNEFVLFDSKPLKDSKTCFNLRSISNRFRCNEYNRRTSSGGNKKYKNYSDIGIRNFIKGLLSKPSMYPDISINLNKYEKIIDFVKNFDPKYKITKSSLSNLKNRKLIIKQVPRTDETISFVKYIKVKYPNFDDSLFFVNS